MPRTGWHGGAQLIRDLMVYSRQRLVSTQEVDIHKLLERLKQLLGHTMGRGINLKINSMVDVGVARIDPAKLENSLVGLALNAREAMAGQGSITINSYQADAFWISQHFPDIPARDFIAISVIDDGPGIAPELLQHVTEPFFSTKSPGESSGLGLSEIQEFLERCGGQFHIQSEVGKGTTVTILLPLSQESVATLADTECEERDSKSQKVILAVSDQAIRRNTTDKLSACGYQVIAAADSQQAQAALLGNADASFLVWNLSKDWADIGNNVFISLMTENRLLKVVVSTPEKSYLPIAASRYVNLDGEFTADSLLSAFSTLVGQ